jgi:hypothetical protein
LPVNEDDLKFGIYKFEKIKFKMMHPYSNYKLDNSHKKVVDVEIEGETRRGIPHGLCLIYFKYNGEFEAPGKVF